MWEALESDLRQRFDVIDEPIAVGGRQFQMLHPRSADDLISEEDFDRDERLPYWAEIWPSARVLAGRVACENGRGRRLLELGCGSGLVAVAAARAGFEAELEPRSRSQGRCTSQATRTAQASGRGGAAAARSASAQGMTCIEEAGCMPPPLNVRGTE